MILVRMLQVKKIKDEVKHSKGNIIRKEDNKKMSVENNTAGISGNENKTMSDTKREFSCKKMKLYNDIC